MVKLSDRFNSNGNGVTLTSVVPTMESGEKSGYFGGGWRNRMIDSLDGNPDKMGLSRYVRFKLILYLVTNYIPTFQPHIKSGARRVALAAAARRRRAAAAAAATASPSTSAAMAAARRSPSSGAATSGGRWRAGWSRPAGTTSSSGRGTPTKTSKIPGLIPYGLDKLEFIIHVCHWSRKRPAVLGLP